MTGDSTQYYSYLTEIDSADMFWHLNQHNIQLKHNKKTGESKLKIEPMNNDVTENGGYWEASVRNSPKGIDILVKMDGSVIDTIRNWRGEKKTVPLKKES